jgi:transcriptional regulator with XRE-family HTH domain
MRSRFTEATPDAPTQPETVPLDTLDEKTSTAIARALGDELRLHREARGWSRAQFVRKLPSQIGDRTLLAYEHGLRQLTILRLIELSDGLGVPASVILGQALQRARIALHNVTLRVDLRQLLQDTNNNYRPMFSWARNRLTDSNDGIIDVTPSGVQELAAFIGRSQQETSTYLAKFTPITTIE